MATDGPGFALPDSNSRLASDQDPEVMVFKPSGCILSLGCPGMFLTSVFLNFLVQALIARYWDYVGGFFVAVLAFSTLWLPFVIYMAGTRLSLTPGELRRTSLFGRRIRRIARSEIARVEVRTGRLDLRGVSLPITNYTIIDKSGRHWARLRTPFFWRPEDGERLKARLGRRRGR